MTVLYEQNGYQVYITMFDCGERKHVHVRKGSGDLKIWLDTFKIVDVGKSRRFKRHERQEIKKLVKDNLDEIIAEHEDSCKNAPKPAPRRSRKKRSL